MGFFFSLKSFQLFSLFLLRTLQFHIKGAKSSDMIYLCFIFTAIFFFFLQGRVDFNGITG